MLVSHAIPTSILDAMARNEILQIVVFSVFFGIAMAALGERTRPIVAALDTIAHIMLKVTGYVMLFAPLAVFGALASIVAKEGLGIVQLYGVMVGEFYIGIAHPLAGADCARRARDRPAGAWPRAQDAGAGDPRLLDREFGSGLPQDARGARALRRQQPDRELRAAGRLLVQSRRLDDVLHIRGHVHRAGLRHRHSGRASRSSCC